jgi:putative PEP-CTERM system integral membrane protein
VGYDDPTLDAIQASGGGAAASVDEALTRLAVRLTGQADQVTADVVDGYQWLTMPTEMANTLSSVGPSAAEDAEGFAPFAARRLILAELQRQRGQIGDLALLDRLHALASNYSIVTPLSSMIVLVNQEQQRLLDSLESRDDRFLREHEDVGETVAVPAVAAVPEPEEWLLIGLAAGLLGYTAWTARRSRRAPRASAG